jgi:hypothetical protein
MKPIADLTPPELRVQLALAFGTRFFVPPQEQGTATVAVQAYQDRFAKDAIERGWTETQEPEPENINWYFMDDEDPTDSMDDAWELVTRHVIPAGYEAHLRTPTAPGDDTFLGKFSANIDKSDEYTRGWYDTTGELALSRAILAWARENKK